MISCHQPESYLVSRHFFEPREKHFNSISSLMFFSELFALSENLTKPFVLANEESYNYSIK